jgi:hypothetical protein
MLPVAAQPLCNDTPGKNLLRRALDALALARLRKADLEIAVHRGLNGWTGANRLPSISSSSST